MFSTWMTRFQQLMVFSLIAAVGATALGQDEKEGSADLDKAFDQKITAQSTKDLDEVIKLCESAIEKGLDKEGEIQAKQLAASTLYEYADQLSQRIFNSGGQDRRWRVYRTQALKRLEKAIEYDPEMVDAMMMTARLSVLPGGDEDKAKEAIDQAIEIASDDREQLSNALFLRASIAQDDEARLSDLNQAIKINPENTDAVRVRGGYYLTNDEPDKALKDLKKWLELGEDNVGNYIAVAGSLASLGEKFDKPLQREALKILDKAAELEPDNIRPLVVRAEINSQLKKYEDAAEDITQALEIDSENMALVLRRAEIYADAADYEKAMADVNEVIELNPDSPGAIEIRGGILLQQEKWDGAIEDFELLAESDPGNPGQQRRLAMIYNMAERPRKAIKVYNKLEEMFSDKALDRARNNPQRMVILDQRIGVLRGRGDARLSTGEHQKAVDDYEEALERWQDLRDLQKEEGIEQLLPPDDGVLNNLAWVLATSTFEDVRDGERAVKLATEAAEATEFKQAHILSTLSSGYAEEGDWENAIKWIEKGIEVNREEGEKELGVEERKRNDSQKESLQKEYESYKNKKAWRENQAEELEKSKENGDDADEDEADEDEADEDEADEDEADKNDDDKDDDDKDDDDKGDDKNEDDDEDDLN